ncbi:MAG: DUF4412 domain-containing protein [Gammaproteobacteria bacterium]|nr:DUF4412 domain-containing protein [Gammaproteobacteria bacterium]
MRFQLVLFLSVLLFASAFARAGVEFSADVVQTIPQQDDMHGKIFVGKDRMRTEFKVNDQTMIQIVDTKKQTAYMLNTQNRSYLQRKAGPGDMLPGSANVQADNPCAGMPDITCKKLGTEQVNGRTADKWEFENTTQAQSGKLLYWLDRERLIPLRQIMPDGSSIEIRLVGKEKVNGRNTEKWEINMQRVGGQSKVFHQWFDPELDTNVREQQPDGSVRELSNITIGAQPAELFTVPAGYKEITITQNNGQGKGR